MQPQERDADITRSELVLVWTPTKVSPIQNLADAPFLVKILRGCRLDTRFEHHGISSMEPHIVRLTVYMKDVVTYVL
jgi:hypothetical protein